MTKQTWEKNQPYASISIFKHCLTTIPVINICCLFFLSLSCSSDFFAIYKTFFLADISVQMAQKQKITSSLCATQRLQPQPRQKAQPEHREVSSCDREGTSTATSKSITTGKICFPKWLERLFPLGQVFAELISWFYVSCLVTVRANSSHRILLEKRKVYRQIHFMATPITLQHGDFDSPQNNSFLSTVLLETEITREDELHKYYFMETQCDAENRFPLALTLVNSTSDLCPVRR